MTMKLFSRKNKKANRRRQRPELKVVEGVDLISRKREHKKICGYIKEMFPEDAGVYEGNKKAPSTC